MAPNSEKLGGHTQKLGAKLVILTALLIYELCNFSTHLPKISVDMCERISHRRGGATYRAVAPYWNLKMMTSYAVSVQNTLKILFAPSALATTILECSLNRQNFRSRLPPTARRKIGDFLSVIEVFPPSGKILADTHGCVSVCMSISGSTVLWQNA